MTEERRVTKAARRVKQAAARLWFSPAVKAGIAFLVLTLLTQVGGVICLAGWWLSGRWWKRRRIRSAVVAGVYLVATLWVVPLLAWPLGRVPLPLWASKSTPLAPRSPWFWILNRHYASPDARNLVVEAARRVRANHPGTVVHYLDAGFPFWDGFVMLPHLSHRSGKVIDLAFCYERGGARYGASPSPVGYGIYEGPKPGEAQPYRRQFSWFRWDLPLVQRIRWGNQLDQKRTRDLLQFLLNDDRTLKVLLEQHLQDRLGLSDPKLRVQQLQAARHDDHLHLVVR